MPKDHLTHGTKFKEPVFVWNDAFLKQNGLKARSIPRGTLLPTAAEPAGCPALLRAAARLSVLLVIGLRSV